MEVCTIPKIQIVKNVCDKCDKRNGKDIMCEIQCDYGLLCALLKNGSEREKRV